MAKKSILEEISEAAFKNHVVGIIISVIFAVVGFFLKSKLALAGAKPADIMFIPMQHFLGSL